MSYKKEVLENKEIKFTFEVSKEDWQAAIEEAYQKTKGKFNIDGFRKGKAPRRKIEAMYGVGVFFEDALDIIVPKYYGEALEIETEVYPVSYPDINVTAITDTSLIFTASVAVKPEVELGQYKDLTLKKVEAKVSADEVKAEIAKAQDKAGSWESVTDKAAKKGDMTVIDYSGSVDGVKFEGGTAEKQNLELGSGMFIPGFEEQVEGMVVGEAKDIKVTFPAEYGASELAGKEAVFAVVLHEIKTKIIPELNDEFVKDVSEFDTVADYKANIKKELMAQKQTKADTDMENEMLDTIAKNAKVEIPDVMIEQQAEEMVREFEYRLTYQGMKAEDYYKYTNTSREAVMAQYLQSAKKSVLVRLVMEAIVKAENIQVDDKDVDAKLEGFAKGANKSLDEYKKSVTSQQLNYVKNEIVTDKLFDFLKKNNKFA